MEPQTGEFIQVLNAGSSHWMTVSIIGCAPGNIKEYDNLHPGVGIYFAYGNCLTYKEVISVKYADVQWQSGPNDCGLFALAFATFLWKGKDTESVIYDQSQF